MDEPPAPLPMLASGHILDLLKKGLLLEPLLVSCDGGQGRHGVRHRDSIRKLTRREPDQGGY
jgi:hypothetical protein